MNKKKLNLFNVCTLLLVLYISTFILLSFLNPVHISESRYTYNRLLPAGALNLSPSRDSKDLLSVYDGDQTTSWEGNSGEKRPDGFRVLFSEKKNIDKVFVNFSNFYPVNFTVESYDGENWTKIDDIKNNTKSYYVGYFSVKSDQLRFSFYETKNGSDLVLDAFFYEKTQNSVAKFWLKSLLVHEPTFGALLFYVVLFVLAIFSGGYLFFRPFSRHFLRHKLLLSFSFGFVFWLCLGLVTAPLFYGGHTAALMGIFLLVLVVGARSIWVDRGEITASFCDNHEIILSCLFYTLFIVAWAFLFEKQFFGGQIVYGYYFNNSHLYQNFGSYLTDQMLPFTTIKMFLYGVDNLSGGWGKSVILGNVLGRPQFFPYSTIYFFRTFGDNFFVFQSVVIASLSMLFYAIYAFLENVFPKKVAMLTIGLVALNYYFLYIFQLTQIKILATFFIFVSFYFLSEHKKHQRALDVWMAGFFAAVAVMTHNFMIIYVIAGLFYLEPNPCRWRGKLKAVLIYSLVPVVCLLVWMLIAKISGGGELLNTVITGTGNFGAPKLPKELLTGSKVYDFFYPRYLNFVALFKLDPYPELWDRAPYGIWRVTLLGAIGLSLLPTVLIGLVEKIKERHISLALILIPLILSLFSSSFPTLFGVQLYLTVSLVLLVGYAASWVIKKKMWVLVTILVYSVERLFVSFLYYSTDIITELIKITKLLPVSGFLLFLCLVAPIGGIVILMLSNDDVQNGSILSKK